MNTVIAALREHLADQKVRFVFPSQTAADLWARKTCTLGLVRSVAADRFLAWDRFKEELIREKDAERFAASAPASSVIRKLFAEALVKKNAEAAAGKNAAPGFPMKSLIPAEYAGAGGNFVPFISRILPSLGRWEKLAGNAARDAEDLDYKLIKKEYEVFLEGHRYFEPSWEEIGLTKNGARYALFFPELIEDFDEYAALLDTPEFIKIGLPFKPEPDAPLSPGKIKLVRYRSAREEIRSAVMEIRKLHDEERIPYEDMAISVPGLEDMEPWLLRELSLRHVPFTRRAGKKLGEDGAGRLFGLVNECAASGFSFNSLKALALNDHIPWKDEKINKELIRFGIDFNCVSGYVQDGKYMDIWEEAFREAFADSGRRERARELSRYYRDLKKRVSALAGSKNFGEIRKAYFAFRGMFLDMEKISGEDNAVLARCVEELGALIGLEEKLADPALVPSSPFGFFLSCLADREYVKAGQKPGVNIFRWRVAAASPFSCHFVLNASQSAATVLYQPMKFLRQDKRKLLGLEDRDASGAFFLLCDTGGDDCFTSRVRISSSDQSFAGWAIPHSFFTNPENAPPCPSIDPYREERRFWKDASDASGKPAALAEIYPSQRDSFGRWKDTLALKENYFSFFDSPVPAERPAGGRLESAIPGADGYITVTPTEDLNGYYKCSVLWLYERIFKARKYSLEAALLDDTSLGLLYHRILEKLFARIKSEDITFNAARLETYKRWTLEITGEVIKNDKAFKGPLAVPLVFPQAAGMSRKLAALLEKEAERFGGYRVAELELPVSLKTGGLLIKGVIDRVSVSPEGSPLIVDYKTNVLTRQIAADKLGESPLAEFQMPVYIKLFEELGGGASSVGTACFYSINRRELMPVVQDSGGRGRAKIPTREEYAPFIKAAEEQIEEFGKKVKALDFIPRKIDAGVCADCAYKTACRTAYSNL